MYLMPSRALDTRPKYCVLSISFDDLHIHLQPEAIVIGLFLLQFSLSRLSKPVGLTACLHEDHLGRMRNARDLYSN